MNLNQWARIKRSMKSRQVVVFTLLGILGVHTSFQYMNGTNPSDSYLAGNLDLSSRGTERVTLSNNVTVEVQWDKVRSNGREVYRITGMSLPSSERGRAQTSLADCGSACSEIRRYIDQRVGFNTDVEFSGSHSAERRRELFTSSLNTQFISEGTGTSTITARAEMDAARERTFRANGENYQIREYIPASDNRLYARVSVEGSTCTAGTCGQIIAIPESARRNASDILRVAAELVETKSAARESTTTARRADRDRSDVVDAERDRRTGDEMLADILADCRREHGGTLRDRAGSGGSTASRRRLLRDEGDIEEYEIGSRAVDELNCRTERFRDLVSADNNNCTREERRERSCTDNTRYVSAQKATQFFSRNIEPHIVRGLVNSTNQAERNTIFDMIHDLDSDISGQYSNVLNRVTALSESAIRSSGTRVQDRFRQAQQLAAINPALSATMENLARQEWQVLRDSSFRLMNTHSMGLFAGVQNGNLTQSRAMGLFTDFQTRISPVTQCALIGVGNCASLGIGTGLQNGLAQGFNLNSLQNRTLSDHVIGGRTAGLRQQNIRTGVRTATGFQPVLPGQLTSYRGLTN
ncbi:MAG: hypothetical protein ACK5P5_07900 [Pseudobdellovibrionaceae bacterium]